MAKQKVSAKEVVADIRSGVSDADLMAKYNLSTKGLESLFEKLIEKNVLSAADIARRKTPRTQPAAPEPPRMTRPPEASPPAEVDPALAEAVVDHVRKGTHKNQLMMEFGLSPSQLQKLLDDLVRLGHLSADELDSGKTRKTRPCPHCSEPMSEGEPLCPNCGQDPNRESSSEEYEEDEHFHEPVSSDGLSIDRYCAWEDRGSQGTVNAYIQTATRCLMSPADFFSKLPLDGGYWQPILFAAMSITVGVLFTSLWYLVFKSGLGVFSLVGLFIVLSFVFVGAVIFAPISMFAWSFAVHGMLMVLKGEQNGFQTTFRVAAYSTVTWVFSAVPFVGNVASFWCLYLTAVGLRETHETSMGKAAGAVLVPFAVISLVSVLLFGLPWHAGSKAKPVQSSAGQASVQYTGAPIPAETCRQLDTFIEEVDAAAARGTINEAKPGIQSAIKELGEHLKGMKDRQAASEVEKRAMSFAMTRMTVLGFQEKLGRSRVANMEKEIDRARDELKALCQ